MTRERESEEPGRPAGERWNPEEWAEDLARTISELKNSLRAGDRQERIRRLLAAVTEHYRFAGVPEPAWLVRARELCLPKGDEDESG